MNIRVATLALLLVISVCSYANAYTIDYSNFTDTGSEFTSNYTGAIVETFDNQTLLWEWDGDGAIVTGSVSAKYAAPAYSTSVRDSSNYLTVPNPSSNGSITAKLGTKYNYFGLWWGSVDDYNYLSFYNGIDLVATISGVDIINPANGNQVAPSHNLYVNLYDLQDFDSFTLTSSSYAFEVDNIAVGVAPLPEPATFILLGSGLAGLAFYRRKRK